MSSTPPPSTACSTLSSSSKRSSTRGKFDPAWRHCKQLIADGKSQLMCLYCNKLLKGGGIYRFKQHLAGIKGEVEGCREVPDDVRYQMQQNVQVYAAKKRKTQEECEENNSYGIDIGDQEEQVGEISFPPKGKGKGSSKRGNQRRISQNLLKGKSPVGVQPIIKSALQGKGAEERCDLAISKWMIDACIPFSAVNSAYFQPMVSAISEMGASYKGPSFSSLRGSLLSKKVEEVKLFVDSYHAAWKETGCTIMADVWTDKCRRNLMNFFAYCPRGTVFLKSVDASDVSQYPEMLYKVFREVVLAVGPENVVHVISANSLSYVAAGKMLEAEFPRLYWSPCAADCINLIFQEIGNLEEVSHVVSQATKITKYVYNNCFALQLMRKHTGGKDTIRPAPSHSSANFIALQSLLAQKDTLRAMVTSREWLSSAYSRESKGKKFTDVILDSFFWKTVVAVVQVTEPLIRVLKIASSSKRPAMGYLYAAIHKARGDMIERFRRRKKQIEPYLKILDLYWDDKLHKNLHAAGFWLNPINQYNGIEMEKHRHTISGLLDVIERYAYGNPVLRSKLTSEMKVFRNAEGDFGRESAISDRNVMMPDEWWLSYGTSAPNLQKLAIRVLSQTCSVSGYERKCSMFEHLHSKKRNRLEHQRLNDLVYVHYNLGLQQRNQLKSRNYDPINFEEFEEYAEWVLEDDPPCLTSEDMETFRNEMAPCTVQDTLDDSDSIYLEELDGSGDEDYDENNLVSECHEDETRGAEIEEHKGPAGGFSDDFDAELYGGVEAIESNRHLKSSPWVE